MKTWKQFLLEKQHDYSSTQVNLPTDIAQKIMKWSHQFIAEEDVYTEDDHGRETEPHVTVLFGLHDNDAHSLKNALKGEKKVTMELKETSIFESAQYDVVKFTVESEDLYRLNRKISDACENTQSHPSYSPHCTISYVKKGTGKKYIGNKEFDGTKLIIDHILFSDKNRDKTKIALT